MKKFTEFLVEQGDIPSAMVSFGKHSEPKERKKTYTPVSDTQKGSNPGGIHTDEHGNRYYVKYYQNGDQAKSEALAGKIYDHMGIKTVSPSYEKINGRHAVVTPWNNRLSQVHPHQFENLTPDQAEHIGRMYHGAVLTKNWDIVGMDHDNIVKNVDTDALHAVDHGGTFQFRARGGHKDYGPDIGEHTSLRHNDEASGHVFNSVFEKHPEAEKKALDSVREMDDNHIHGLFKESGLKNWQELHANFMERKKKLLSKYE
jgi:hypothetical protein